jgi:hypothetical protein
VIHTETDDSPFIPSAILAGGSLPLLGIVVCGIVCNSGIEATVVDVFLLSPLWILFGIIVAVAYYRTSKIRRMIWAVDAALLSVIAVFLIMFY